TRCLSDWSSDVCSSDLPHLNGIATDLKRIDADDRARQPLANVGVHALDHGDDGDEKRDGDDDAEQGEEGSQLVAPDGQEREAEQIGRASWREREEVRGG